MTATNDTNDTTVSLSDVYDYMRMAFATAVKAARNWYAVTVHADGDICVHEEVSKCESPAEYYRQGRPHPVDDRGNSITRLTAWDSPTRWGELVDEYEAGA